MMPSPDPLFMVNVVLDGGRLFKLERRLGLPARSVDLGYLAHCQLAALFGDLAPSPFRVDDEPGRVLRILGYSRAGGEQLRDHARLHAEPDAWAACDWGAFASKPMPEAWPPGTRLHFEVRVAPVVRKAGVGAHCERGAEVDAFLARCWAAGDGVPVDREAVYCDWIRQQIEGSGAARLVSARMVRFKRSRLVRRTQGVERKARLCERPDAVMEGRIEVTGEGDFGALLGRGLGRHRAFGFGMLLLRADRGEGC